MLCSLLVTLGAHAQRGLQYLLCVSVCLSVCLSVTALAATTFVSAGIYSIILGFPWISTSGFSKGLPFKSYGVKSQLQLSFRSPHAVFAHFLDQRNTAGQLVGRILLQRLATGATGVKQARYRRALFGQRGTRTRMRSIHSVSSVPLCMCVAIEGPWHLLFNVRHMAWCNACIQWLHMNSAEGFAL